MEIGLKAPSLALVSSLAACAPGPPAPASTDAGETGDTTEPFQMEPYEPDRWRSTKTHAYGLHRTWTDGERIFAVGAVDLVAREGGEWIDVEVGTEEGLAFGVFDVWGLPGQDPLLLARMGPEYGLFHAVDGRFDPGEFEPLPTLFPTFLRDLTGASSGELWIASVSTCDYPDIDVDTCLADPSGLWHHDGEAWERVAAPGPLTKLWTDGSTVWGVGGRGPYFSYLLPPVAGVVASFDGDAWTVWSEGELPILSAIWARDNDDVWVGGEQGTLRRLELGVWVDHDLPTEEGVIAIEGRDEGEVWALTHDGQLWAFDGLTWAPRQKIEGAIDLSLTPAGVVVVGAEEIDSSLSFDQSFGHRISLADEDSPSTATLFERHHIPPDWLVADDGDHALLGHDRGTWSWDGASWSPTLVGEQTSYSRMVGEFDLLHGFAPLEDEIIYEIAGSETTPIAIPSPVSASCLARFEVAGKEQLWIADYDGRVFVREDETWSELSLGSMFGLHHLSQGGDRVFGASDHGEIYLFEDGVVTDISIPPPYGGSSWLEDLVATGPEELWVITSPAGDSGAPLYLWDGAEWTHASEHWPGVAMEPYARWEALSATGPDDLWMVSRQFDEPAVVVHFDGTSWSILGTPPLFYGGTESARFAIQALADSVYFHDGLRLWVYQR